MTTLGGVRVCGPEVLHSLRRARTSQHGVHPMSRAYAFTTLRRLRGAVLRGEAVGGLVTSVHSRLLCAGRRIIQIGVHLSLSSMEASLTDTKPRMLCERGAWPALGPSSFDVQPHGSPAPAYGNLGNGKPRHQMSVVSAV